MAGRTKSSLPSLKIIAEFPSTKQIKGFSLNLITAEVETVPGLALKYVTVRFLREPEYESDRSPVLMCTLWFTGFKT